jgi:hypothetical protein
LKPCYLVSSASEHMGVTGRAWFCFLPWLSLPGSLGVMFLAVPGGSYKLALIMFRKKLEHTGEQ